MTDPAAARLRSFIAIPLPQQLQQQIATLQQQLRVLVPELKPANPVNLHLTLHFLGELSKEQLAEIGQIVLSIGQKKKNFNVTLGQLGFFPHQRRPRVLWMAAQPADELQRLHTELGERLQAAGVTVDQRPFRPHLTIGRFKQPPRSIEPLCPFLSHECGTLPIDRIILYTSELTRRGAIHTPLNIAWLNNDRQQ